MSYHIGQFVGRQASEREESRTPARFLAIVRMWFRGSSDRWERTAAPLSLSDTAMVTSENGVWPVM